MIEGINPEIADLARWLDDQCRSHSYGTFGITATVHAGKITRIERQAVESLKPEISNGGTTRGSRRPNADSQMRGAGQ